MSRSNYSEDCDDDLALGRWRGAVASAIRGHRGQKLLAEMAAALDAMPEKRLIKESLESPDGVCALGCLGKAKGMDLSKVDPEDPDAVAKAFGIAMPLAAEIAYMNDEVFWLVTPEQRWDRVRKWVQEQIKPKAP